MNLALVEDNDRTRARIAKLLRQSLADVHITQFGNLKTALQFAGEAEQDYWLIDLGLPDGSGIELIQFVRHRQPTAAILVVSSFGNVDNILRSIQAGAHGYLLKDAIDQDLIQAIASIDFGGTPLSPMIASRLLERMMPAMAQSLQPQPAKDVSGAQVFLSGRETELLDLLARGYRYAESAELMGLSIASVQTYVKRIYVKLAVTSKAEAVFEAKSLGLISA